MKLKTAAKSVPALIKSNKKITSSACLKGSITIEASIAVPLTVFAFMVMLQFMSFMNIQVRLQSTLYRQAEKAAQYSYLVNTAECILTEGMDLEDYRVIVDIVENGITEVLVKHMVISELGEENLDNSLIEDGSDGLRIVFSPYVGGGYLDIMLYYRLEPKFNVFGVKSIPVIARARVRQWTGTTKVVKEKPENDKESEAMVYVTPSGTVYHTNKDCTYIKVKLTQVNMSDIGQKRNSSGGRYYPCSSCFNIGQNTDKVYIAKYGDRYHADKECRQIYHNIKEVPLSQVENNMNECSKCRNAR